MIEQEFTPPIIVITIVLSPVALFIVIIATIITVISTITEKGFWRKK
jgi:hypothetical protein